MENKKCKSVKFTECKNLHFISQKNYDSTGLIRNFLPYNKGILNSKIEYSLPVV